jgi:hypothetical protein
VSRPISATSGASALKVDKEKYRATDLSGNRINQSEPSMAPKAGAGDSDGLDVASVLSQLHAKVLQRTFKEAQLKLLRSKNLHDES